MHTGDRVYKHRPVSKSQREPGVCRVGVSLQRPTSGPRPRSAGDSQWGAGWTASRSPWSAWRPRTPRLEKSRVHSARLTEKQELLTCPTGTRSGALECTWTIPLGTTGLPHSV